MHNSFDIWQAKYPINAYIPETGGGDIGHPFVFLITNIHRVGGFRWWVVFVNKLILQLYVLL